MLISVIIPCYNSERTLPDTLHSLCAQNWHGPWEIILSDNRCTDGSVKVFNDYAAQHPHIPMRVVDAWQRKGQPHALNQGVREARGQSVAFCDADDAAAPDWLAAMVKALQSHDFVAARMDLRKLNEDWVYRYRRNQQECELQQVAYPPYLPHAGGGTIGLRKTVFERVGEFDDRLPILHDTDFCFRAQLAGFALYYVPDAVIYVRSRSDLKGIYWQAFNYAKYNLILSKRYRHHAQPAPHRWRRFWGLWLSSARLWLRPCETMEEKACARFRLGWAMGLTAGIFSERCPPP